MVATKLIQLIGHINQKYSQRKKRNVNLVFFLQNVLFNFLK